MARLHETPVFPTTHDDYEEATTATGFGCFRRLCFGWVDEEESHSYLLRDKERGVTHKEAWFVEKFKKLREFSEVVAGPKWKNLIRKISKICNPRRYNKATVQFQYSPESYALNFAGGDEEEDANLLHSFSTRFAPGYSVNDQRRAAL